MKIEGFNVTQSTTFKILTEGAVFANCAGNIFMKIEELCDLSDGMANAVFMRDGVLTFFDDPDEPVMLLGNAKLVV